MAHVMMGSQCPQHDEAHLLVAVIIGAVSKLKNSRFMGGEYFFWHMGAGH